MNILAGGQFQRTKPQQAAPKITAAAVTPFDAGAAAVSAAPDHATNVPSDAAMPSIPSMKLKRLSTQTIPRAPTSVPTAPSEIRSPPTRSGGSQPNQASAHRAAVT